MRISIKGETLHGHHFVLSARSEVWANESSGELDLTGKSTTLMFHSYISDIEL